MSIQRKMDQAKDEAMADVVVLGAGMAGLAAARALAERGLRVCVVEAKDRVGGRLMSRSVEGGGTVELGAEFVHGRAAELWALIDEAGVKTVERRGSMLREEWGGGLVEDDPRDESMFAPLERLEEFAGEDVAFADWLAASDVEEDTRRGLTGYVEGFNAADAARISVRSLGAQQRAEDEIGGDRSWHVIGGYAQLAEYLAERVQRLGGEVRLQCEVLDVRWSEREVLVATTKGEVAAKRCVVALPLGVVQRVNEVGGIRIMPEPLAVEQARRLAMGHAARFTMVFRERWWERGRALNAESLRTMSFLFTAGRMPPVWWTSCPGEPSGSAGTPLSGTPMRPETEALPALTGWVGGPRASALEGKDADELGREACGVLAEVFGINEEVIRSALVATYTHDWAADPFARGAYSYVPVGAIDASAEMTRPEAETMFFAGEHTDVTANWGTVHAAIRSGLRAAVQVLGDGSLRARSGT